MSFPTAAPPVPPSGRSLTVESRCSALKRALHSAKASRVTAVPCRRSSASLSSSASRRRRSSSSGLREGAATAAACEGGHGSRTARSVQQAEHEWVGCASSASMHACAASWRGFRKPGKSLMGSSSTSC